MDWLKQLAPTVATALLGPLGGVAVSALGNILGVDSATQEKITNAIQSGQMTPEQISQIKALELQYQNEEKERGFRYEDLAFKDRDSARTRDSEFIKVGRVNGRANLMFFLAVIVICCLVWIVWKDPNINEYVKGIFTLVLGRFLGYLDNIYSFEFGTTRSSQSKDSTIERLSGK